jgi:signal transduction histidine kinase
MSAGSLGGATPRDRAAPPETPGAAGALAHRYLQALATRPDADPPAARDAAWADEPADPDFATIRALQLETARLHAALDHLAQSNREQAEFAYAISHDLKLPSNTILMLFDELASALGNGIDHAVAPLIQHGRATALRLRQLVNDVLSYSRCVEPVVEPTPLDLDTLVHDVAADLDRDLVAAGGVLTIGPLPCVLGVRMQISQLFHNLIANAIRFRAADRPLRVRVDSVIGTGSATISVRDNGIGIPDRHLDRLFMPGPRLHGAEPPHRGGIGLALCARIAASHGTRLAVESEPGVGTTFSIGFETAYP